jgi:hypothetical protein
VKFVKLGSLNSCNAGYTQNQVKIRPGLREARRTPDGEDLMNQRRAAELASEFPLISAPELLERCLIDPHIFRTEDLLHAEIGELLECMNHVLQSGALRAAKEQTLSYSNGLGTLANGKIDQLRRHLAEQKRERATFQGLRSEGDVDADKARHLLLAEALRTDLAATRRDNQKRGR